MEVIQTFVSQYLIILYTRNRDNYCFHCIQQTDYKTKINHKK